MVDEREECDGRNDSDVTPFHFLGPIDGILRIVSSIPVHDVWIDLRLCDFRLFFA